MIKEDIQNYFKNLNNIITNTTSNNTSNSISNDLYNPNEDLVEIFHELKNPIAIIKINLDLIKEYGTNNFTKNFNVIENEINKIDNIIKRYLDFNNPKNAQKDYIYFSDIINLIIEENKLSYPDVIYFLNDKSDSSILAHEYQLYMVFSNIIKNSIESMKGIGKIIINISESEGICNIEIIDNGYGITDTELNLLSSKKFTTKPNGTGIGTSIIKNIINIYDGEFYLLNNVNGTKAVVKFPLSNF